MTDFWSQAGRCLPSMRALMATLLVCAAALLTGCRQENSPSERVNPGDALSTRAAPVDSFYATVEDAELEGAVARVPHAPRDEQALTLLDLDFENGREGALFPFAGVTVAVEPLEKVSGVEKEADGNQALHIGPGLKTAAAYQTLPIPVSPGAVYTLSYSIRTEGLRGPESNRHHYGSVEALFYKVKYSQLDPIRYLNKKGKRKASRRRARNLPRQKAMFGDHDWEARTLTFRAPKGSSHLILSFDHSRSRTDGGVGRKTQGHVWFDNIKLIGRSTPIQVRYANPGETTSKDHPLRLLVELPARDRGGETRIALYAPAPSVLTFKRTLPAEATFSVAAGVVSEGWATGEAGVRFTIRLKDGQGKRHELLKEVLWPSVRRTDRYWKELMVDLSDFEGQDVAIELVTKAVGKDVSGDLPGAAAVWGDPVLMSRTRKSRLIVLTVLDTARADRMSAYGYHRPTTPNLERIAGKGVRFTNAYAAAPWTLPSFASLFTGLDAARHGAGERAWGEAVWRRPLAQRFETLAERLRLAGFQTVAFMNNPYLTATFGLGQGFTTYRDYGVGTRTGNGEVGANHAIEWLEGHRGYDRFLVLHLMDAHGPYRPPAAYARRFTPWFYKGRFEGKMGGQDYLDLAEGDAPAEDEKTRRQVQDLYDGALLYADAQVGRLHDAVMAEARGDEVTFIVTSDHGEEFWEHGSYEHGHQAHEEMLRVPLIIESSTWGHANGTVSTPVRLTDLAPTILEALELPPLSSVDGQSLLPLLSGKGPGWQQPRAIFAESELYGSSMTTLRLGAFKYLYNMKNTSPPKRRPASENRHELYDLMSDPGEQEVRTLTYATRAQSLHQMMEVHLKPMLAGRYVLVFDGGGQVRTFEAELAISGRGRWFPHYEDLIAPLADGTAGTFKVRMNGSKLHVTVTSSRAVLAFRLRKMPTGPRDLQLAFKVDGQPWEGGLPLATGERFGQGKTQLEISDALLTMAPEALPSPGESVGIMVARTTERLLKHERESQRALPPETAERLRALGYIE